jgi:hypothetical protein
MRVSRSTVPAVAASVSVVAVLAGLAVSSVDARKHHHVAAKPAASQHLTVPQREAIASQLRTTSMPKNVRIGTLCPSAASTTDVCFGATLPKPATNALVAGDDQRSILRSLGVTLGPTGGCEQATGSPFGGGFLCDGTGFYRGTAVRTLVFVSDQTSRAAGVPAVVGEISVLAAQR